MNKQRIEVLIKAVLVILMVIIIVTLLIKRFVYFRPSSHFVDVQESYKPINHKHLYAWLIENNQTDKIVLFCHGNTGNISHRRDKIYALRDLGYSVLIFDYSGYGKSSGIPSEQQLYDDASLMAALLRQTYQPQQIVLYGESIGGPVATYVARRYSIPTLILESTLPSIKTFIQSKYPLLGSLGFLFPEFDTAAYLYGYKGRSLLLHSPTDEIIPYESTIHLQKMCTLHIPIDGSHNLPIVPWQDVKKFIDGR